MARGRPVPDSHRDLCCLMLLSIGMILTATSCAADTGAEPTVAASTIIPPTTTLISGGSTATSPVPVVATTTTVTVVATTTTVTVTTEPADATEMGELPDGWEILVEFGGPLEHANVIRLRTVFDPDLIAERISLIAVGGPDRWSIEPSRSDGEIWLSADGVTWERVVVPDGDVLPHPNDPGGLESGAVPLDVAVGGPGLVAVGVETPVRCCLNPYSNDQVAAVWTSERGRDWARVQHDPEVFGGAEMLAVASDGDLLVAVGFHHEAGCRHCDDLRARSVVWASEDGYFWTRLTNGDAVFEHSYMFDVVAGPGGFVAAGYRDGLGAALLWHSPDGLIWTRIELGISGMSRGSGRLRTRTTGGPGYVFTSNGLIWISVDGISWARATNGPAGDPPPGFARVWIRDLADTGNGLVAVGYTAPSEFPDSGADPVPSSAIWTSPNGFEWHHIPFGPDMPRAVAALGDQIIVIGRGKVWATVP